MAQQEEQQKTLENKMLHHKEIQQDLGMLAYDQENDKKEKQTPWNVVDVAH